MCKVKGNFFFASADQDWSNLTVIQIDGAALRKGKSM